VCNPFAVLMDLGEQRIPFAPVPPLNVGPLSNAGSTVAYFFNPLPAGWLSLIRNAQLDKVIPGNQYVSAA